MATNGFHFIGVGLYTVPEASRLSRVSVGRIRRWLRGYSFTTRSGRHRSPPVFLPVLKTRDGTITVTFFDLIEIRFVDAFISAGVGWKTLKAAHASVQTALGPHPFSRGRFWTDGRRILQAFAGKRAARAGLAFVCAA